jgi:hypothetical protein
LAGGSTKDGTFPFIVEQQKQRFEEHMKEAVEDLVKRVQEDEGWKRTSQVSTSIEAI